LVRFDPAELRGFPKAQPAAFGIYRVRRKGVVLSRKLLRVGSMGGGISRSESRA